MSNSPQQLTLELPHRPAHGAEDFLVSGCNEAAVLAIDRWPDWPHPAMAVTGPPGSGKSHLVNVWRSRSSALTLPATSLSQDSASEFGAHRAIAIEDIDRGIADEQALFHILNMAAEHKLSVLLTSRRAPGELTIALPDLRSRLRAVPVVSIASPDEALLRALLVKLFADRQLAVEPHVISYLALRIERSTEAAQRAVAEIDRLALATRRRVTRALVAEVLARLAPDEAEA
jgi:chromosomal replication initiation ATPase DnaA